MISNVNIPNTAGQIPNLPASAVVETNAVFSRDSIAPIFAGNLTRRYQTADASARYEPRGCLKGCTYM